MRQIVEAMGIKPQFDTDTIPKDLVRTAVWHRREGRRGEGRGGEGVWLVSWLLMTYSSYNAIRNHVRTCVISPGKCVVLVHVHVHVPYSPE